jgi:hypothetical protein
VALGAGRVATYADAVDALEYIICWLTAARRRWDLHFCLNGHSKQTEFIVTDLTKGLRGRRREDYGKKVWASGCSCIVRRRNGDAL